MNILRLYHTIRHLRFRQVVYRAWYPLKKYVYRTKKPTAAAIAAAGDFGRVSFITIPLQSIYTPAENTFRFLNITHSFGTRINWDFPQYGRLWTYNLNYFDWLEDENIDITARLQTVHDYIAAAPATGKEPYPASLSGINIIRFLARHAIHDAQINSYLHRAYQRLSAFPEYHIGANHLLENACSIFYAAHYFNSPRWYRQATDLLKQELAEQILPDGGHYERSPMYHCIILYRLLCCFELSAKSRRFNDVAVQKLLYEKCSDMLGWLQAFIFADGSFAMMGDAAPGIAPAPAVLFQIAAELDISCADKKLKESGFRKLTGSGWELLINLGVPSPAWQPGHAHADTFSFCLQVNGRPLIVDTGISGYEKNERRYWEKSTDAHNTIVINNKNTSDVWHGFRVGQRASVTIINETDSFVTALHNGYSAAGVIHERTYRWDNRKIIIEDRLKTKKRSKALLHLHFHPDVSLQMAPGGIIRADTVTIRAENTTGALLQEYSFCAGFNARLQAPRLEWPVDERIAIVIEF